VSAPDSKTLRRWLDHGVPGPLVSVRFSKEPGRPLFVCKINGEDIERVAKIECDDSESPATAHLFASAPEVAEELLAVRAKMDAARKALRDYHGSPAGSAHFAWNALCAALGVDELAADGGAE
jgi:hypothetical protein